MAIKNSLVEKKQNFSSYITSDVVKNRMVGMMGEKEGMDFITSITSAVSINPKLKECEQGTIVEAALQCQSLKLSPSPVLGQFFMIPYKDKKRGMVARGQMGYKGYIQLAIRSGYYKKLNVLAIKEGELVKYDPLNEEIDVNIIEDDEVRENAKTIGYYAMFEYQNGFRKTLYWSKKKMEKHADKYSPAFNLAAYKMLLDGKVKQDDMWQYSSFWYSGFDGQALKTMIIQLISKWGIMSIDLQKAVAIDSDQLKEYTPDKPSKDTFFDVEVESEEVEKEPVKPLTVNK